MSPALAGVSCGCLRALTARDPGMRRGCGVGGWRSFSPPGVTPDAQRLGAHHGTMRQVRHTQSRGSRSHNPHPPRRTDPGWTPRWPVAIGGDDRFAGIEVCALPRRPLRRQGPISGCILRRFRRWREMDTCLRRYLRNS